MVPRKKDENEKGYAYRVLKSGIMSLELKPGEALSETELAKKLNSSRTPIREALSKLKEEYLIEVKPQIGTYVSLIDMNLVRQALFMRHCIEKEAMKLACSDFPEDSLIKLEQNLLSQKYVTGKQGSELEFHKLDEEFHRIIFAGLKLEEVWKSIQKISTHYIRLRVLSEMRFSNRQLYEEHEKIFNLIRNKDSKRIEESVTDHIKTPSEGYWDDLLKDDSEYKEYFKK
ncbi:MAG: transcriptional regulator [Firmicutes bacterium]|nr:transcriptional regulator [Bacillota bacterium]